MATFKVAKMYLPLIKAYYNVSKTDRMIELTHSIQSSSDIKSLRAGLIYKSALKSPNALQNALLKFCPCRDANPESADDKLVSHN